MLKDHMASLEKAFAALSELNWGDDVAPLQAIEEAVVATHGNADERAWLEGKLAEHLQADGGYAAKDYVCRQLRTIGTAKSVPPLAKLLGDEKTSHMARYALERIPEVAAGDALRDALGSVGNAQKIGVMSSLGVRGEDESIGAIAEHLGHSDAAVARSAAVALGAIGSPAAAQALTGAKPSAAAALSADDASLACAESLLAHGKKAEAKAIYMKLAAGDRPKHVKLAATKGMLSAAGA